MALSKGTQSTVLIGRITAAHGVRGWLKLKSLTDPPENLLHFEPWLFTDRAGRSRAVDVLAIQRQGAHFIAKVAGCEDRDAAEALKGTEVRLPSDALPEPEPDEYYWNDLIGLAVKNAEGSMLGVVRGLMETGAHDVLVIKRDGEDLLIPFVAPYLERVRLGGGDADGEIVVDWQADWS